MSRTFAELQTISHDTSFEKGWWRECIDGDGGLFPFLVEEQIPKKRSLIHSEVSEALEDFRDGKMVTTLEGENAKPVGFPTEIADIVIRVMDLAGARNDDLEGEVHDLLFSAIPFPMFDFRELQRAAFAASVFQGDWLEYRSESCGGFLDVDRAMVEEGIPDLLDDLHRDIATMDMGKTLRRGMAIVVCRVMAIAHALEIDLLEEITIKQSFNATRPDRHGGKRC